MPSDEKTNELFNWSRAIRELFVFVFVFTRSYCVDVLWLSVCLILATFFGWPYYGQIIIGDLTADSNCVSNWLHATYTFLCGTLTRAYSARSLSLSVALSVRLFHRTTNLIELLNLAIKWCTIELLRSFNRKQRIFLPRTLFVHHNAHNFAPHRSWEHRHMDKCKWDWPKMMRREKKATTINFCPFGFDAFQSWSGKNHI